jgi:replicative DNA helicase
MLLGGNSRGWAKQKGGHMIGEQQDNSQYNAAEQAVLGCILLKPVVFNDIITAGLIADDFSDATYQRIYLHLLYMHIRGKHIDATRVVERLKECSEYELLGGADTLASLVESVPHASHAVRYARIVADAGRSRRN